MLLFFNNMIFSTWELICFFHNINGNREFLKHSRCIHCQLFYSLRKEKLLIKWWEQEKRNYKGWLKNKETKCMIMQCNKKIVLQHIILWLQGNNLQDQNAISGVIIFTKNRNIGVILLSLKRIQCNMSYL